MNLFRVETADGEREAIPEGAIFYPFAYYVYISPYQWLDNSDEAITLLLDKGLPEREKEE